MKTKFTEQIAKELCGRDSGWICIPDAKDADGKACSVSLSHVSSWDWKTKRHVRLEFVIKDLMAAAYKQGEANAQSKIARSLGPLRKLLNEPY